MSKRGAVHTGKLKKGALACPCSGAATVCVRLEGLFKLNQFKKDFDRFTGNTKLFQPIEADWGGFRIVNPRSVCASDGHLARATPRSARARRG